MAATTKTKMSKKASKQEPAEKKTKDGSNSSSRVDKQLVEKAVAALVKHHNENIMKSQEAAKSKLQLLGTDRPIQVQFTLEMAPVEPSRKPKRIEIPHPLYKVAATTDDNPSLEDPDVCLIVKEESKPMVQDIIQQFPEYMGCVKKVLGLDSLRKKHAQYAERRELLHKYDVFMADDRILPMLTTALGKHFIKAKKLPIPVAVTRKEALPLAIQKNLSAAFLTLSEGTSVMVRAGNTGMPLKNLTENIIAIADNAVQQIPRKWANIRGIAIKTPDSQSLPFYNKTPEELLEIAKIAGVQPAFQHMENKKADETETSPGKRKLEIAAKSPLVQALKKQKNEAKEAEKVNKMPSEVKAAPNKDEALESKKGGDKKRKDSDPEDETAKKKTEKSGKGKRQKQLTDVADEESTPKEAKNEKQLKGKGDFISSKKFKGSKKGYVFMNGKQGLGYYVDVKPIPDKLLLETLTRRANQSDGRRGGGSRRKSGGKRKGRR